MTPENPLLLPRTVWQIALVVTLILVAIRVALYVRDRKRAAALEAEQAAAADAVLTEEDESATVNPEDPKQEQAAGSA